MARVIVNLLSPEFIDLLTPSPPPPKRPKPEPEPKRPTPPKRPEPKPPLPPKIPKRVPPPPPPVERKRTRSRSPPVPRNQRKRTRSRSPVRKPRSPVRKPRSPVHHRSPPRRSPPRRWSPYRPLPRSPRRKRSQPRSPESKQNAEIARAVREALDADPPERKAAAAVERAVRSGQNEVRPLVRLYHLLIEKLAEVVGGPNDLLFTGFAPTKVSTPDEQAKSTSTSVVAFGKLKVSARQQRAVSGLAALADHAVCIKYAVIAGNARFRMNEPLIAQQANLLVMRNNTPHILLYLVHLFVPDVAAMVTGPPEGCGQKRAELWERVQSVNTRAKHNNGYLMVSEYADDKQLSDRNLHAMPDLDAVVFQVLYTLAQLPSVGITHYDPHAGNILMRRVRAGEPRVFVYFLTYDMYVVCRNSASVPLLFDWDMGHFGGATHGQHDKSAVYCVRNGICDVVFPPFDGHRFIRFLLPNMPQWASRVFTDWYTGLMEVAREKHLDRYQTVRKVLVDGEHFLCGRDSGAPGADPGKCAGSAAKWAKKTARVDSLTETNVPFLPWPRLAVRAWIDGIPAAHRRNLAVLDFRRDGFDHGYLPGSGRYTRTVFFDAELDRARIEARLSARIRHLDFETLFR